MKTIAVFVAVLAAASAATITESHRLGGNFAYSTSEVQNAIVGTQPVVHHQQLVSPVATSYSSLSGVPIATYNANSWPVASAANTHLGNVAVVRSGVQSVVPATSIVQAGTPANTYRTVAGVSPLSNIGYYNYPGVQYVI